jgi:hypothetical protein
MFYTHNFSCVVVVDVFMLESDYCFRLMYNKHNFAWVVDDGFVFQCSGLLSFCIAAF